MAYLIALGVAALLMFGIMCCIWCYLLDMAKAEEEQAWRDSLDDDAFSEELRKMAQDD